MPSPTTYICNSAKPGQQSEPLAQVRASFYCLPEEKKLCLQKVGQGSQLEERKVAKICFAEAGGGGA